MACKKIKVLHFPIRNTNGGITRSAMKYWKYINHDHFQFDFATCSKQLYFEKDILDQGCKVHYLPCYAEEDPVRFCDNFRKILAEGYDAIHLNTSWWRGYYAEQVAVEMGVKVIVVHARAASVEISDNLQREKEQLTHEKCKKEFKLEYATHFLACSKESADFLFGPQIPRERIKLFHNALDVKRYSFNEKKRIEMRMKMGINEKFVIGMVGRLSYIKNHLFLLDCFNKVQQIVADAQLLIIGDGEMQEEIENKICEFGLNDKVILVGAVDNVEDYLQAMDIFAFPSLHEGLGNVLIEAQASGLKCLASKNVPLETKITNNVIYLELDKKKWVEEICNYKDGYLREKTDEMVRSAGYDIEEEIKILEKIYMSAVEG